MMILLHIIADFNLQTLLAQFKQKEFWLKYDNKYHMDWIGSLLLHSIQWTLIVMFPINFLWLVKYKEVPMIIHLLNIIIHMIIDHLKCNKKIINLNTDQFLHFMQILITWLYCVVCML